MGRDVPHPQCHSSQCEEALGCIPCLGCHTCSCLLPLGTPPDSRDSCGQLQVQLS